VFLVSPGRQLICTLSCVQVRGSTTPVEEQAYILRHSRSSGLIVQVHLSCQLVDLRYCNFLTWHPELHTGSWVS
jgi:hypothetical protein